MILRKKKHTNTPNMNKRLSLAYKERLRKTELLAVFLFFLRRNQLP